MGKISNVKRKARHFFFDVYEYIYEGFVTSVLTPEKRKTLNKRQERITRDGIVLGREKNI